MNNCSEKETFAIILNIRYRMRTIRRYITVEMHYSKIQLQNINIILKFSKNYHDHKMANFIRYKPIDDLLLIFMLAIKTMLIVNLKNSA